jgi:Ca-activated chloride channel family protein
MNMKHRLARKSPARLRVVLAVLLLALAAGSLPRGLAAPPQNNTDGRPRRTAAQPQQKQPGTPAKPAAQTPAARPTPTPAPPRARVTDDDGDEPPPPPKLKTSPVAIATPTPDPNAPVGQEVDEDERVIIDTQLINLNVRVVDRNNRSIKDVRKEDFIVYDNGVRQAIESFETKEVPISYGIVVDNSGSLRGQINQVIDASKTIINSNREGDEAFVVRFVSSEEIKVMQDWTASKQDLIDAMDDMFIEGGQTAIIDATYLAAEHAASHRKGNELDDKRRRALILVTDGEDRASFYRREQLFESLRESDVQIYVIGFINELDKDGGIIRKSKREKAVELLERLAKETGGRAFYPNALSELPGIAEEITKDMRTQYVVSYLPTNKAQPGEFRAVRVQIADAPGREKRIAITRSGYTAPRAQPASPAPAAATRQPRATNKP